MKQFVLDASLALQWFLEDETGREYALAVLVRLSEDRAIVPPLWFYEIGNGLLMAHRRKRISIEQLNSFVTRLRALPIDAAPQSASEVLELPALAQTHGLTNYDAAYLALAIRLGIPLATTDNFLRKASNAAGIKIMTVAELP